jgi:hypothetical protein
MGRLLQTGGAAGGGEENCFFGHSPTIGCSISFKQTPVPNYLSPKTRGLLLEQGSQSDQAQHSEHGPGLASVSTGRTDDCHLTAVTRDDPRRRHAGHGSRELLSLNLLPMVR